MGGGRGCAEPPPPPFPPRVCAALSPRGGKERGKDGAGGEGVLHGGSRARLGTAARSWLGKRSPPAGTGCCLRPRPGAAAASPAGGLPGRRGWASGWRSPAGHRTSAAAGARWGVTGGLCVGGKSVGGRRGRGTGRRGGVAYQASRCRVNAASPPRLPANLSQTERKTTTKKNPTPNSPKERGGGRGSGCPRPARRPAGRTGAERAPTFVSN